MNYDDPDRNRRHHSSDGQSGPPDGIHPAVDVLSEYLDQAPELAGAERDAIDRHLISCERCQRVLSELQLMVRTLGALPEQQAPRSFAIRTEALEPATKPARPAPVVLQESAQWHTRHAGKVRWATAVASILFVLVISADLLTNGLGRNLTGDDDMASDGDAETVMMQSTAATPAADAAEIPTAEIALGARTMNDETPASDDAVQESNPAAGEEVTPGSSDESPSSDEDLAEEDAPEVSTFMEPEEAAESSDEAGGEDATAMKQEASSEEPASEAQSSGDPSQMRWRIAEMSLALILAMLLTVMIGLPKQRGRRQ